MEKRLILAIALSLFILVTWSALVSKQHPIANKEVITNNPPPSIAPLPVEQEWPAASLLKYTGNNWEVVFIEPLAAIKEIVFKAHQDYKFILQSGLFINDRSLVFKKENSPVGTMVFVQSDEYKKIVKRFIFSNTAYDLWLEINVQNKTNAPLKINFPLFLGALDLAPKNIQGRYQDVIMATREKAQHIPAQKNAEFSQARFLGLRDRYFCAIIEPEAGEWTGFVKKANQHIAQVGLSSPEIVIAPQAQAEQKFHIYLGPQDLQQINSIRPAWSQVIHYGTFDFISQLLLQLLRFLYGLVHNWGWAIVALSLLIYFALYPLSLKQMRSMKEMQLLQPQIEELRQAYKDNPQKLNKEIMELYRQHKVNPFGGCLPLLLQMPIFFALYQALMRSIALKGAAFLWIKDLSEPDRLFILPTSLPVLGNEINILPIVMAIGMFFQQKLSMSKAAGASAEQQKMMMVIFPLMFGLIFYHMPAGLVLYWLVNSTLMLVYQLRAGRA